MKRKLIPLLCLLFSLALTSFAQNVLRVEISGNKNVSEQKILSLIQTRPGTVFSAERLGTDMKKLGETGYFRSVKYETKSLEEGTEVLIYLVENPQVESISFNGNKAFRSSRLAEVLGIKKGDIYNEIVLQDALKKVEEHYKEKGFLLSNLTASVDEDEGKAVIKIKVYEGVKGYVREIEVKGNSAFKDSRILKLMKTRKRAIPFKRGIFKEDLLEKDLQAVRTLYHTNGFIDANVEKTLEAHEKGGIRLAVNIEEGRQFFLGKIGFSGNLLGKEKELTGILPLKKKGSVLNRQLLEKNKDALKKFYFDKGYITVNVMEIPLASEKDDEIDITYSVEPGEIYRAGEIKITGNTRTKDKVIRREIEIEPSDTLTSDGFRKSYNNLFDLNYFDSINIYPEFISLPNTANIVVDVAEKEKTGIFLIGGGYSSVDDIIGVISIQQTNFDVANPWSFSGGGQNMTISLEMGTEARNYTLSFTEPYFMDKPISVGPDIYRSRRLWNDYTEQRTGINLRAGRRWDKLSFGLAARTENIELSDIDIVNLPSIAGQEGEKRKNSLTATIGYSSLDSKRAPSMGNMAKLSLESAGSFLGGDTDFIKPVLDNDFYKPFKKLVFHSKTRIGYIKETGDTEEIPIYERFFGGGIGTVRGYEERSFGPKDPATGEAVGGKALFAQNFELIYPLYENILKAVLFFDVGNIWDSFSDFSDMRKGAGAGVKVVVPILNAPIEVYYGFALDRKPSEDSGQWHVGMSFGF